MPLKDEIELHYNEDEDNILINKGKKYSSEDKKNYEELEQFLRRFIDITLENQRIISNVVRSNESLREDLAVLIGKVDRLFDKFEDFVEVVKAAAEEDSEEHLAHQIVKSTVNPFMQKFEEFTKTLQDSNQMMLEVLTSIDKRMKRLQALSGAAPASATAESTLKERMLQLLNARKNENNTTTPSITSQSLPSTNVPTVGNELQTPKPLNPSTK